MSNYRYYRHTLCVGCQTCWELHDDGTVTQREHFINSEDVTKELRAREANLLSVLDEALNDLYTFWAYFGDYVREDNILEDNIRNYEDIIDQFEELK